MNLSVTALRTLVRSLLIPIAGCGHPSSGCSDVTQDTTTILNAPFTQLAPRGVLAQSLKVPGTLPNGSLQVGAEWVPGANVTVVAVSLHPCSIEDVQNDRCTSMTFEGRFGSAYVYPGPSRGLEYFVYVVNRGENTESGTVRALWYGASGADSPQCVPFTL